MKVYSPDKDVHSSKNKFRQDNLIRKFSNKEKKYFYKPYKEENFFGDKNFLDYSIYKDEDLRGFIDCKVRDGKWYGTPDTRDIAFETEHQYEDGTKKRDGWLIEYQEFFKKNGYRIFVLYGWWIGDSTRLYDDFYLLSVDEKFISFYDDNQKLFVPKYKPSFNEDKEGSNYYTFNAFIPISILKKNVNVKEYLGVQKTGV